ncbi:MAG: HAMP domain-containing histidine kinase [Planctomycetes bacterium]|nr:HAMP domain-containing histidine kinase [Planctomycetota bacterium]
MSWPRTIGARLGLFNAGLVLASLLGLGGAGLAYVDRVLIAGADRNLHDELLDVAVMLEPEPLDPAQLEAALTAEAAEEAAGGYDVYYRVTRPDGTPVATSAPAFWSLVGWHLLPADGERKTIRLPHDPHRLRLHRNRLDPPTGPVCVDLAVRLEPEDLAMTQLLRAGALAVPLVIGVAAVLGAFMARRALAPVDAIERAARTIGAGPRGRRLPATGTRDELDRLSETLNAMLERLERAAQRNLAFAGDVAHEVRTPLAVVRARLEQAQAAGPSPALDEALAAVGRLEGMVRSLLALARADEGGAPSAPQTPTDLVEVAGEVVGFFAPAAEARGIDLRLRAGAPAPVLADRTALARAVANLVDNAVAYAPARTAIEVEVEVDQAPGWVTLSVADGGPGVPDDLRPLLFERFARGAHAAAVRPDGAGLGLPLVRAVARGLGGEAEHAPRPGGGSVFRVRLPLHGGDASAMSIV